MRAVQGALILASTIQIVLGYSQLWGMFSRFFSPLGMTPVIGLVGLGLFERGFPAVISISISNLLTTSRNADRNQNSYFNLLKPLEMF